MARPRFATTPRVAELAAVERHDERVDAITAIASRLRTLPKSLADLRKESLQHMLAAGWTKSQLAERYQWSPGRVTQLTKTTTPEGAAA